MGFLIAAYPKGGVPYNYDDALGLHLSCIVGNAGRVAANVTKEQCKIACVAYNDGYASMIWSENSSEHPSGSFVFVFGWCYRIGSSEDWPNGRECQEILVRYRKGFAPLDENYSGNYAVVIYDAEREKIAIQPDHWAMCGIYYSVSRNGIVVSNRSVAVASVVCASLDGYSILSLLRGTHMPFGRTLFSDVHRVMCGCYVDVEIATMRFAVKRSSSIYVPIEKRSFVEASEGMSSALCAMARRWLGTSAAMLDLTGGNDTRLAAAAVLHENPGVLGGNLAWCVAGHDGDPDVQIATRIAQTSKWPLIRLNKEIPADKPIEWLQKSILQADGMCLVGSASARVKQELDRGREWSWHIGSIGGELLRGFFWRHELLSLGKTNAIDYGALLAYRLYASRQVDTAILGENSPSLNEHDEVLLAPYRRIGDIAEGALNPYKLDVMYLHKLCYSAGSTQSWLAGLRNIQFPLISWEVSRETLSIPWNLRATRRLILQIINSMAPQLAEIPNDAGEPMKPLTFSTLPAYMKHSFVLGRRSFPRLASRYIGIKQPPQRARVDSVPRSWIPVVLDAKRISSIFDRSYIKEICMRVGSTHQTLDLDRAFQTMLTLELMLQAIPHASNRLTFESAPVLPC